METERDSGRLCDALVRCGSTSASCRLGFQDWLHTRFGGDLAAATWCKLADWVAFVHLGALTEHTPVSYFLAWFGAPYVKDLAKVAQARTVQGVLDAWSVVLADPGRVGQHVLVAEVLFGPMAKSEHDLFTHWGDCLALVEAWLTNAVYERHNCAWADHEARDAAFDELKAWLQGGWRRGETRGMLHLRELVGVVPVPWRMLRDFQHRARMDLPTDLRRLLLEVGDVGKALFFALFLRVHNATEGLQPWVWTERVEFVDVDGKVRATNSCLCQFCCSTVLCCMRLFLSCLAAHAAQQQCRRGQPVCWKLLLGWGRGHGRLAGVRRCLWTRPWASVGVHSCGPRARLGRRRLSLGAEVRV